MGRALLREMLTSYFGLNIHKIQDTRFVPARLPVHSPPNQGVHLPSSTQQVLLKALLQKPEAFADFHKLLGGVGVEGCQKCCHSPTFGALGLIEPSLEKFKQTPLTPPPRRSERFLFFPICHTKHSPLNSKSLK